MQRSNKTIHFHAIRGFSRGRMVKRISNIYQTVSGIFTHNYMHQQATIKVVTRIIIKMRSMLLMIISYDGSSFAVNNHDEE